ncbi:eukaryotic translation initiation factor 4E-binding protein 3-like [Argonauta hians]
MSGDNKSTMYAHQTRDIPAKRILINDPSQMPMDYSTTPGGSVFSTTPGGTRIFYDRAFLLQCRNSPLAKSPPANMAQIPGITMPGEVDMPRNTHATVEEEKGTKENDEQPQFQMDI